MEVFASALVGHLVGDYLFQNDWMALNKKASSFHCAVHCFIWTVCVMAFSGVIFHGGLMPVIVFWILFGTHFLQDRTGLIRWYMRAIGQEKFATGPCSPWSIIVVDNVWHIVTIWLVWKFLIEGSA